MVAGGGAHGVEDDVGVRGGARGGKRHVAVDPESDIFEWLLPSDYADVVI